MVLVDVVSVSCRKQYSTDDESTGISVTATIAPIVETKITYSIDDGLKQVWTVGDHILGWDEDGNGIEFSIAEASDITADGVATFSLVSGTIPAEKKKVYLVYAPGKTTGDIVAKTLAVNISAQSANNFPALMSATGIVAGRALNLTFENRMSVISVVNPTFLGLAGTKLTGLRLAGTGINTIMTFSLDEEGTLIMTPSTPGEITVSCALNTGEDAYLGKTEGEVRFATCPANAVDFTISTVTPSGYMIVRKNVTLSAGIYYTMSPTFHLMP